MSQYKWTEIYHCLNEQKLIDYDDVVKTFTNFGIISQFASTPKNANDFDVVGSNTEIRFGQMLYGIREDGSILLLRALIDSSD